jgi:hypothetical protein
MLINAMNALFKLLLENPRAVIESGVVIPCALHGLLALEDDEVILRNAGTRAGLRALPGARHERFPDELRTG